MDSGGEVWPFMMRKEIKASLQAVLCGCLVLGLANISFDSFSRSPGSELYLL